MIYSKLNKYLFRKVKKADQLARADLTNESIKEYQAINNICKRLHITLIA